MSAPSGTLVVDRETLPRDGHTYEFEGRRFVESEVSFIWVDLPPGSGVRLHEHPYEEILIIEQGSGTFTVGATSIEGHAGQVIVVPAHTPHKFMNAGNVQLRQVDIHVSREFITHWLEE